MRTPIEIIDSTLTVDPGWHTGWAWWKAPKKLVQSGQDICRSYLKEYGIINLSRAKSVTDKFEYMCDRFETLVCELEPEMVYIEGTAIWEGSLKSMTAAKRGNIMTLSYLIGGYMRELNRRGIDYKIISANDWKGQANDSVIATKCDEIMGIGLDHCEQHTLDAIGIGLSGFGLLERKVKYKRGKRNG